MKMRGAMKSILIVFMTIPLANLSYGQAKTDTIAEKMLVYQRNVGGWPKMVNEIKVDYNKPLSAEAKKATMADANRNDATIDNEATFREINYLTKAYTATANKAYLQSAEKGIRYLLKAQNAAGGWPQYYPDSSLYRAAITFNDNAMMHVMQILDNVANKKNGFDVVDPSLVASSAQAVKRGIDCILKTQIKVNGKLTGWNQQYDRKTLQPIMARKFELVGITPSESTEIVKFLMKIKNPSPEIKLAVKSAVEWLDMVKIKGYRFDHIKDTKQTGGKDAVLVADPASTIWARYYEIGTNKPFFSGRDSQKKYNLTEIEVERRAGYAWYGTWPKQLLEKDYPLWAQKNLPQ
jgi:PelA/Pel-15E family pectate lyase